jgi:hypothetical protein
MRAHKHLEDGLAMPSAQEQIAAQRDAKVRQTLGELAPIWLVYEEFRPREDAIVFNLVYNDPSYGWMNRRFKYDGFNDVLYHMGWRLLSEAEQLEIVEKEPYIDGEVAVHVKNAPQYRTRGGASVPR